MVHLFRQPTNDPGVEMGHFRIRLMARLIIIFISLTQVGQRLYFAFKEKELTKSSMQVYLITMPFLAALILIVLIELLLYKKLGYQVLKYSRIIDIIFFLVFTLEWLTTLYAALIKLKYSNSMCYSLSAVFGFTSFSWRTLLQTFVAQHWQFKIVPPVCAYILVIVFTVTHDPAAAPFILLRGCLQISYVILIFFFENKINFKLMLMNMQQEHWVQINQFILSNIPENIAILDLTGKPQYISEHFTEFIKRNVHQEGDNNLHKLFQKIKGLRELGGTIFSTLYRPDDSPTKRLSISQSISDPCDDERQYLRSISSLEDLLALFKDHILNGRIKEKSFQIFDGKLAQENMETRSVEIKISFVKQHSKQYIILILRDTTQRDLLLTLEGNNNYKDRLLASVSHELRTPLNGNINLVEAAIKSQEIPDNLKEGLLVPAIRSSKFLLHLINDILDMSQVKAQKLRLAFQQTSLKETLLNTVQLLEIHARKKGIILEAQCDPSLPKNFSTDHVRLSQIILNLVNNSIKFTHQGFVRIFAAPVENTRWIKISVEDSGIGMTKEDIDKLFKDFTHIEVKDRANLNPTGVGLGLSIAYQLASLLGPKDNKGIVVESTVNVGSTFSFIIENKSTELKIEEVDDKLEQSSSLVPDELDIQVEQTLDIKMLQSLSRKSFKKMSDAWIATSPGIRCLCAQILVVDDDPFNVLAFEAVMGLLNQKCDCVYSGKSAIDKILNRIRYPCGTRCQPYKIIFMDQEMPGMNGIDTTLEIKSLQRQNLLPFMKIVGCTAHHDRDQIKKFLESGIVGHVEKPISVEVIRNTLERHRLM